MEKEEMNEVLKEIAAHQKIIRKNIKSSVLLKATGDCFDYACKLRTGDVIRFSEVELAIDNYEWVTLKGIEWEDTTIGLKGASSSDRGIEVRVSDIVWLMDAPKGS